MTLRLLTLNVWNISGPLEPRYRALAAGLKKLRPDIVCLQEVCRDPKTGRSQAALVADAIDISRRTYAKIRQNLFWAFVYNVVGIPLAALGILSPVLAGAAMALSSVSVVGNTLLLKRWKANGDN